MKKRIIGKFVSLLLAVMMGISMSVPAFAVGDGQIHKYSCNGLNVVVEYIIGESIVTEKSTIYENGYNPIIVEKTVSPDGTIKVYQNGIQTKTLSGGSYENYLAIAKGQYLANHLPQLASTYATYPCGYNQNHMYVTSTQETVDVGLNNTVGAITAAILSSLLHPVAGVALGTITAIAQYATSSGADYIDISETKYFVHGAYANDMNCYHALYTYYNKTSTGGKNVIKNEWVYTQELV